MASNRSIAVMARLTISPSSRPIVTRQLPLVARPILTESRRYYAVAHSNKQFAEANRRKKAKKVKVELPKEYNVADLKKLEKFSLCDAMRIIRAMEAGRPPTIIKYDLAVRLFTNRHSRPLRNRITLPHPVKSSGRILVICPEGSKHVDQALAAGAIAAGEESVFQLIREKKTKFTRVIAHEDSMPALESARLGPILRNLMPSPKTKTVTREVPKLIKTMAGAEHYRERLGTIRLPIGQLGFTPKMLSDNISAFVRQIKKEMKEMSFNDKVNYKRLHEVVLSSTHGPGLTLDGTFAPADPNLLEEHLAGPI